ncbi:peptide ABC transporter ATP-binding protein [Candidatus Formimonas warabiya]|uniref:Peptide ABC transporter ATP-binding protein n=1 Tax=Formimonas warabiya TaxID=1761012 RepID=A0A3G1L2T6_FORW1|nr:peptide ABC transporter ATP-binding protein [Candidatus Formimonas warabiya]
MLEVKDLTVSFKKGRRFVPVVENLGFGMIKGETLGIVGESGCGKSVTALSIMGLLPKGAARVEGKIRFNGKDLHQFREEEFSRLRGQEIAMIFQDPLTSLDPVFSIGSQLMEGISEHTRCRKKEAFSQSVEMLRKVGIPRAEEIMDEFPHQLSGGMRQRVMIAGAMCCHPDLLIADEPTTALDVTIQAQILDLMGSLQDEFKTAIILITHDMGVVAEMCDRVMIMYAGKIMEEGSVKDIFRDPKHQYTVGLMNSIPSKGEGKKYLFSIKGTVPLPEEMPAGCRFAPRCEAAQAQCLYHQPPRVEIGPGHFTSCWLYS